MKLFVMLILLAFLWSAGMAQVFPENPVNLDTVIRSYSNEGVIGVAGLIGLPPVAPQYGTQVYTWVADEETLALSATVNFADNGATRTRTQLAVRNGPLSGRWQSVTFIVSPRPIRVIRTLMTPLAGDYTEFAVKANGLVQTFSNKKAVVTVEHQPENQQIVVKIKFADPGLEGVLVRVPYYGQDGLEYHQLALGRSSTKEGQSLESMHVLPAHLLNEISVVGLVAGPRSVEIVERNARNVSSALPTRGR
ncbi:MAG: hypothetical protein Athens071424_176 [Parcubacteria group bacterium Athens0714_24]|nr:MAG: hypothetical protein Athens071424_176 [Parcubacteria group bacterium Athens0714_24]